MKIVVKFGIAIILLGCLLQVPFGYFQFARLAGFIGFLYLAYIEFEEHRPITGLLSVGSALLLNPLIRIHFKRHTWNQIDLWLAVALIVWAIVELVLTRKKTIPS